MTCRINRKRVELHAIDENGERSPCPKCGERRIVCKQCRDVIDETVREVRLDLVEKQA